MLQQLANEILELIGSFLDMKDYQRLRLSSTHISLPKTQTVGWKLYKQQITNHRLYKQKGEVKAINRFELGDWIRLDITFLTPESFLFLLDQRQLLEAKRMLRYHHKLSSDVLEIGMISLTHLGPCALPVAQAIYDTKRIASIEHGVFSAFCALGMTEIVRELLRNTSFGPADNQRHFAIVWPCRNGHFDVVQLLLEDGRINPAVERNWPIQAASTNNHPEIVKLLLKDPRVDPSAERNAAIHQAQVYGNFEVVSILLQDSRVNPFQQSTTIVEKAFVNMRFDILNQLLLHPRFQYFYLQDIPDEYLSLFLQSIIQDKTIDPHSHLHWSLRYSATKGELEFIQAIFQTTFVNPFLIEEAMNEARRQNHLMVAEFLRRKL